MSARLGDGSPVTTTSGGVTVLRAPSTALGRLGVDPESDPEKTLPIRRMTTWVLLRQAIRFRLIAWRWPKAGHKLIAAAVLVVLAAVMLRAQDTTSHDRNQTGTAAKTTSTGTPGPALSQPAAGLTPVAAHEDPGAVAPRMPSTQELAALPRAVIGAVMEAAPADPAPPVTPGTTMLHPKQDIAVYAEPGGCAFAALPVRQVLTPTWVPVVERKPGWALVLLPTRPHPGGVAAAGWIHLNPTVELAEGDRRIEVDTTTGRVSVLAVLGQVTTNGPLGATRPAGTVSRAVVSPGTRSFVAIGGQVAETSWLLRLMWPFHIDTGRVCTGTFSALSVPGLPASSPLGSLDPAGCVATPPCLHSALTQVPAGTPVLLR
ncbi:hypothetical protein [Lentzea sp. NPDC059081]|uniref:hypothetical protein n=1 Tax=Lentzea sp. NPDC059081 TaxID=3346719 RepID=UPI0036971AB4